MLSIPAKRQREESVNASPRQAPGGIPGSRSQTPGHVPFPGFNPQINGAPSFSNPPTPFQHLQNNSNPNTTPSPVPQQMNFHQNGPGQRVATTSPSPFSPHHPGSHMSPSAGDQNRMGTPQDAQQFAQKHGISWGFQPPYNFHRTCRMRLRWGCTHKCRWLKRNYKRRE